MTFGTVGCWPAGPIRPPGPWCLGPARGVPRPAPGRTSWAGLGKVRSWFLRCSEGDVWHRGLLARGPDPSSRAMVFGPCEGGPSTRAGPHFMGWFREGSKLVSTVFRRWRLAPWAAGPRARSVLQGHGVWALRGGGRAQTPWPWRTDGPAGRAHGAKRHLLNTVETSFEPSLNQPMKCGPARVEGPPSQGPNTMALEDGSGPRASSPRCQTSPSEHRRNQLRTFPKPAHEVRPGAGRGTPLAGPKHHGPGGRIGPAGQQPTVPNVTFWTP